MSIRINLDDKVAASESREITPLPTGKYLMNITDAEIAEVKSAGPNTGKPMLKIEFTCSDAVDETLVGRKCWSNIMLFGKPFSYVWLMKALGHEELVRPGEVEVPDEICAMLLGEQVVVRGEYVGETTSKDDPNKKYAPKYEVRGYLSTSTWKKSATAHTVTPTASVLP